MSPTEYKTSNDSVFPRIPSGSLAKVKATAAFPDPAWLLLWLFVSVCHEQRVGKVALLESGSSSSVVRRSLIESYRVS